MQDKTTIFQNIYYWKPNKYTVGALPNQMQ